MTIENLTKYPVLILQVLAVALVSGTALVVVGGVVLRLFGVVPEGTTELATLFFVWAIYIGAFLAIIEGGHLAITALVNRLRGRVLTAVTILSDALLLTFTLVVTIESFTYVQLALDSIRLTPSLHISPAWSYSAVLVGMALVSIYVGGTICLNIVRLWKGEEPPRHLSEAEVELAAEREIAALKKLNDETGN